MGCKSLGVDRGALDVVVGGARAVENGWDSRCSTRKLAWGGQCREDEGRARTHGDGRRGRDGADERLSQREREGGGVAVGGRRPRESMTGGRSGRGDDEGLAREGQKRVSPRGDGEAGF